MPSNPINVLFLCTGNTARSILAEGLLRHADGGRFRAFSAGSSPKGTVNPLALKVLAAHGISTEGLRSKSWEEFGAGDAPTMDCIITVCDNAAGETCPLWPGRPVSAHWGIADPAAVEGSDLEMEQAFELAFELLARRIKEFAALPVESLDARRLQTEMRRIGHMDRAIQPASEA